MLELPHTLVGAAIGSKFTNPLLSLPLAFASHFVLDIIPHWNPSLYTETKKFGKPTPTSTKVVILDTALSLAAGLFIASRFLPNLSRALNIVLACFAAVVADVIEGFYFFLGLKPRWLKKWILFQSSIQGKANQIPGLLIQVLTIILVLAFLSFN